MSRPILQRDVPPRYLASYPVRSRIGQYVAVAPSIRSFEIFNHEIAQAVEESFSELPRLVVPKHLQNIVAQRLRNLSSSSRRLIEGYLSELAHTGELIRIGTVGTVSTYYVVIDKVRWPLVKSAINDAESELCERGTLIESRLRELLPAELRIVASNARIIMGVLAYRGIGMRRGIDSISLPG